MKKAIIALGYNRADSMWNLLQSLKTIQGDGTSVPLIISIDNGGTDELNKIAKEYEWHLGEKKVIIHQKRLGLKQHFMFSGDITEEYDNVILLEDDLIASPFILEFCNEYLRKYNEDNRVAGASLYNPILKEGTGCKFYQIQDGFDSYFLQQPYWGNIWSRKKWVDFKEWLKTYTLHNGVLPKHVQEWKDTSFKKVFIQYLIERDMYFVTPRISLVTNNGDAGVHNTIGKYQFQCNVQMGPRKYMMPEFEESCAVYDAYFELLPEIIKRFNLSLTKYDFYVDIYRQKPRDVNYKYCLTTRQCKNPIMSFSNKAKPKELAVLMSLAGNGLCLCKTDEIYYKEVKRGHLLFEDIMDNYMVDFDAARELLRAKVINKLHK